MDIDPNKDDSGHRGVRPGTGRKRKEVPSSIQAITDERRAQATLGQEISRYRAKLTVPVNGIRWSHQVS
ncbi:unnamed protein product [Didymodactylos carnosus]|uniref:Uncharacterized protein n=1 Tax=Didymodactylos carnosus TaxID=1234261 RepID=A0A815YG28_9BILA|nr:unnamed protein product [Didymodactylos carnosus]CAF1570286.1 unnamed protein product [Didymodactylos carnosus]CAF4012513.1 unnamed protein product [Didymodactylos carnosus]CAF4433459.1 unnamed protein product [Didymodactylos carnosus]